MQDGQETATDCGGPTCMPCDTGDACKMGRDCASGFCTNAKCDAPSCTDGAKNGTESDKDCGGTCPGCDLGGKCTTGTDCASKTCTNGVCVMGPCMNGKQDGMETDKDCGGPDCMPCDDGLMCNLGTDCKGMICTNNVCHGAITCVAPMANCDNDDSNGCEANTKTDAKNCGKCGMVCPMGMPACVAGNCEAGQVKTIGYMKQLPDTITARANFLYGFQVPVLTPSTVLRLGIAARAGGPRVKLALYSDRNGEPGDLLASTAPIKLVAGQQEVAVNNVRLPIGGYYLMTVFEADAQIVGDNVALIARVEQAQRFSDPLPQQPVGFSHASEAERSMWMVVLE